MGEKYNCVLRGVAAYVHPIKVFKSEIDSLCMGNLYVHTLHALEQALGKLCKVSRATKLYRCTPRPKRVPPPLIPSRFAPARFAACGARPQFVCRHISSSAV